MKRKLNKKSLYQEGGAMSSTNPDDNSMPLAKDISGQMEMGVPAINIYKDLISQYIPQDEIDEAFQQLGYSSQDVSKLSSEVSKLINSEMQQSSLSSETPQAQYGGYVDYVNAPDYYLPENLGQKGNVLGAAAFLGKTVKDLFGGKDRDGDGLKDGAFRQLGKKQKAFKNFKNQKLQSFIPGTTSDTIDDEVGPNINSDGYDPELEVENYLKQVQDEERSRLSLSEPDFPVTSATTSYKKGGVLAKYQMGDEVMLPEVTVTPFDNVQPNLDNTFDTITPDFTEIEDVNKNGIPDYLEGVDPTSPGVSKMLPEVPASPFDNVMPDMTNTFDDVQSSTSTDTTDEDLPMYGRNPFVEAFGKGSTAVVAGANLVNEIFQNKKASDAEKELRYSTMADKIYGAYNERPGSRGMYDVNTGLAQPDNLDVGYARMGKEVSADLEMLQKFMGGGKVYDDMFTSYYKKGGEFEPHMMYNPETGEGYMAEKMEDHLRMKEMGYLHKEEMKEKKQQGGEQTPEMESYLEALEEMKIARQAIGTNDKETLGRMGLKNPYNTNDLARDFSYLQQLRKDVGLGAGEEAKILFPYVGQQIRGTANRMLGTNYEQGGEVEVDNQTLAALIAAGADIEII